MGNDTEIVRLLADKVKINGPKVDGSYNLSFEVGEYEQSKMASLMMIPQNTVLELTVGVSDE